MKTIRCPYTNKIETYIINGIIFDRINHPKYEDDFNKGFNWNTCISSQITMVFKNLKEVKEWAKNKIL